MALLNFDAVAFESQQLPEPLPALEDDPFPANCGLTADQKSDLGKVSDFVGLMDTPAKVVEHWRLLAEHRAAQRVQQERMEAQARKRDPVERARLQEAKAAHDTVVSAARVAWRDAVATRNKVVAEHNAIVKALHDEFIRLKTLKVE